MVTDRLSHDGRLRRLFGNSARLAGSNAVQSLFGVLATLVTARALGVEQFGKLVLLSTYALVVMQLFSFQSLYAVVRVGTIAQERSGHAALLGVVRLGILIDVGSALFAAVVAGVGVWIGARLFGLTAAEVFVGLVFSLAIATNAIGAVTGLLRMRDRYGALVWHGVVAGTLRLVLCGAVWLTGGGLLAFGLAWAAAQVAANGVLFALGIAEIRAVRDRGLVSEMAARDAWRSYPQLKGILVTSNLTATMRMLREADVLAIGWLLDSASAGLFRIARQIGSVVNKGVDPFFHAIYPEMARALEQDGPKAVVHLLGRSALLVGALALGGLIGFTLFGEWAIILLLGQEFDGAFVPAVLCILGGIVWAFAHPLTPALMVFDRHRALFRVTALSSVAYLGFIAALGKSWGIVGAAFAFTLFHLLWTAMAAVLLYRTLTRMQTADG